MKPILLFILILSGCSLDLGDQDYFIGAYQPMNPLPVVMTTGEQELHMQALLRALPNEAVRLAVAHNEAGEGLVYRPFSQTASGSHYVVVFDYLKYQIHPQAFKKEVLEDLSLALSATEFNAQLDRYETGGEPTQPNGMVPTYIGIGVRLKAYVEVKENDVKLDSLLGLGTAAGQDQISGSLVFQLLGVSGEDISPLVPLPCAIDVTSIQNAIQAIASIKAVIYDSANNEDNTGVHITPHMLGFEDFIAENGSVQSINTLLLESRPEFQLKPYLTPPKAQTSLVPVDAEQ